MKIVTKSTLETYSHLTQLFRNNKRVFYSRFGDGDIVIMMGKDIQKYHRYSEELQEELLAAFEISDPLYVKGLAVNYPKEKGMIPGLFAPFSFNDELEQFLVNRFTIKTNTAFESAIFFHYLAIFKHTLALQFLNEFIRPTKKLYIGAIEKHKIENLIGTTDYYVQTPARDAYYSIEKWWPQVEQGIQHVDLVIPAAGICSRVINKRLWNAGIEVKSFDIGSIVDTLEPHPTRKWIKLAGHRANRLMIHPDQHPYRQVRYIMKEAYLAVYTLWKTLKS